jgi:hypothetical protein
MANNLVLVSGSWVLQQISLITSSAQALAPTFWGSGIDGSLTTVGTYTQTYSLNLSSLTIPSGTIFKPNGYPTFVSGTTTINAGGSYNDNGLDASGITAGTALTQRNPLDGRSGGGGNGRNTSGVGNNGGAASAARTSRNSLGVLGKGGPGGDALPGFGQSLGGSSAGTQLIQFQNWPTTIFPSTAGGWTGGAGGGGGSTLLNTGTATSGAGGSGGGIVWLVTKFLINNGTISCNGGNGSNAVSTGDAVAGGGGGGQGGFITLTTSTPSASCGVVTSNGGSGGTGAGGGGTGSVGELGIAVINSYA